MKLNREEFIVGALHGLIAIPFVGWLVGIPLCVITGLLFAIGGAEGTSKAWRRAGIPFMFFWVLSWQTPDLKSILLYALSSLGAWGVLSIGYGIPSVNDSGSDLGKYVFYMIEGKVGNTKHERIATIIVRSLLYSMFGACYFLTILLWL